MSELQRTITRESPGPGPGSPFDDAAADALPGSVTVRSSLYMELLPVAGATIAQIREQFRDRLEIDPGAMAAVDGQEVPESHTLRQGQVLQFINSAGEKGHGGGPTVTFEGPGARATAADGAAATIAVPDLVKALNPALKVNLDGVILPDGVRSVWSDRGVTVFLWEFPPARHRVRWIAADSPDPAPGMGAAVKYEPRTLAMPYILLFLPFIWHRAGGRPMLHREVEAFFSTRPATTGDEPLLYPALLNVSAYKEEVRDKRPLAWLCTQHLRPSLMELASEPDINANIRRSFQAIRSTLLEAGFNYSSETQSGNELCSHYSLSAPHIPEIRDIAAWEEWSKRDPLRALRVPWRPAGVTVRQLAKRTIARLGSDRPPVRTTDDIIRVIFNSAGSVPVAQPAA